LSVAIAICEAIGDCLPAHQLGLKWPNDVYLAGRKVCGILLEVPPRRAEYLVVGIGLNVNNSFRAASPSMQEIATSLCDVIERRFELPDVLLRILKRIEERLKWLGSRVSSLPADWHPRCLLRGKRVHVDIAGRPMKGLCHGIDEDGALQIETDSGIERTHAGTVTWFER
jgi:BirA family biotin operon repressor/biotin-[acetyl-CoA-carboxylase] ligase